MDLDEAWRELDVAPLTAADDVRRAYLRRLKKRKPEVDPEGFARLRAAFELITEHLQYAAFREQAEQRAPAEPPAAPAEPSPAELPPAAPLDPIEAAWRQAFDAAQNGGPAAAASLFADAMQVSAERAEGPSPAPIQLLFLLLELHVHAPVEVADRYGAAFLSWLERSGRELQYNNMGQLERLLLAKDLQRVAKRLPEEVRKAIAQSLLEGDPGNAGPKLAEYARVNPASAETATWILVDGASLLHTVFSPFFAEGGASVATEVEMPDGSKKIVSLEPARAPSRMNGVFIAIVAILLVVPAAVQFSGRDDGPTPPKRTSSVPTVGGRLAREGATLFCRHAPHGTLCMDATAVGKLLDEGNCFRARGLLKQIETAVSITPKTEDTREDFGKARDFVRSGVRECRTP